MLWEVFANNDSEHPSYLFGTYHGNGIKGDFTDSIPGLSKAFNSVTQYIGESNFSLLDSEEMQGFYRKWLGEISMPVDTSYKILLNKTDYEYVDFLVRFHLRMFMDRKHIAPNYLSLWLVIMMQEDHMQNVFDRRKVVTVDEYLQYVAVKKGYTVKRLDSPEIKAEVMKFRYGDIPFPKTSFKEGADSLVAVAKKLDLILSDKFPKEIIDCVMNLENAYRAQDIKQFVRYQYKLYELNGKFEEKCGGASLWSINEVSQDSFIIMGRNNLWIDKITGYMAERPSFIGVGVNHLFGEKGLISLLRKQGYKVKPIRESKMKKGVSIVKIR
ncbi:lipoprotein [Bacteroidia bacterium]|nr:lipoprotein [Bacteroidia bacterium]